MSGEKQTRKGPSVCLQATLPTSETISIDAEAGDTMEKVKERIGSSANLCVDRFTLTFDGEEVGGTGDGRVVGDLPFEDQSILQVVLDKKREALMKLQAEFGEGLSFEVITRKVNDKYCDDLEGLYRMCRLMAEARVWDGEMDYSLHDAVLKEYFALTFIGWLLAQRNPPDVNATNDEGSTPLHHMMRHLCVRYGPPVQALLLLLQHGADINARDRDGMTPLHWFTKLAEEHSPESGVDNGYTEHWITVLMENGADLNSTDNEGNTPLHLCLEVGCFELARLLLTEGSVHEATCRRKNNKGLTLLHLAVRDGTDDDDPYGAARLLLSHGADVHAEDKEGRTPLYYAKEEESCEMLLEHNARTDVKDKSGDTPLHLALREGEVYSATCLLEKGHSSQVTLLDKNDCTPLHVAASVAGSVLASMRNKVGLFADLLKHGASLHARDCNGRTPLHIIVDSKRNCSNVVELFLEHGADVLAEDNEGNLPVDLAITGGVIRLLRDRMQMKPGPLRKL